MSQKRWTFTTYEDGKPVAAAKHLTHDEAVVALRVAVAGEDGHLTRVERLEQAASSEHGSAAALAAAAALVRAA